MPIKSSPVKLNPLVLLKDWIEEHSEIYCVLQPAMPKDGNYTMLSMGILQKWLGYVTLNDSLLNVYLSSPRTNSTWERINTFNLHDPESFPAILNIMRSNKEVKHEEV